MAQAYAVRTFLAALLLIGQFAGASLAAEATAQGAPCPVYKALGKDKVSAHHGHHEHAVAESDVYGSGHEQQGDHEEDASPHFSFACCAACAATMTVTDTLPQAPDWIRKLSVPAVHSLEPGELPSTDPPPRILL